MANIGDVFLRLLLDDSDFEKQAIAAGTKAGTKVGASLAAGLSSKAGEIGKSLSTVGKTLTSSGTFLTRSLTLPIVAAGAAITHFSLDFDTSMRRIVGLAKVPQKEIQGVRDSILKMAQDVGRSPQSLAEAFYFVASAGFKADEAMKVLEISAKASASGMGEVSDIAKVLGAVLNAYGHENISAAHAGDVLTAAVQDGAAEASDFATALGNVVPTAAALGVSLDQVTAAMASMTNVGIDAETSAVNLNQIFSALLKPTSEANTQLQAVGLSAAGLRSELREKGLLAVLRTLQKAFEGNDTAFSQVFGNIRALRGINALLALDEAQLNAVFADTKGALGNLADAYNATDGPQRKLDKAMAELQATAISLGADVMPTVVDVVKQIADGLSGLVKWFKSLDEGTRKAIIQWLAWAAVLGPILIVVGKLATGLGAMFKVVGFLLGAKGIPKLITELKLLGTTGKASLGWLSLIAVVGFEAVAKAAELGNEAIGKFRKEWDAGFGQHGYVPKASAEAGKAVEADAKRWTGNTVSFIDDIGKAAEQIPTDVAAALVDGAFVVKAAADEVVSPVAEALQKAKQKVADATNDLIHTIATILSASPKDLEAAAKTMWEAILHPFPDIKRRAAIEAILASKAIADGLHSKDSSVRAQTAEFVKGLLAQYDLMAPGALAAGELVNPALEKGINSNFAALETYLGEKTGLIKDKFALADELAVMGYDSLAAYVRGMETARLQKLHHELLAANTDIHTGLPSELYPEGFAAGRSYSDGMLDGLHSGDRGVVDYTGKIKNLLQFAGSPPYTHSREAGEGVAKSWLGALIGWLRNGLPALASTFSDLSGAMTMTPALAGVHGSGMAAAAGITNTSSVVTNYNLSVNGVQQSFRSRDDFIGALDKLSAFKGNTGRIPNG